MVGGVEHKSGKTEAIGTAKHSRLLVGTGRITLSGHLVKVTPGMCQILGYGQEDLLKKAYCDITYPEDYRHEVELFAQMKLGNITSFDITKRFIRGDGSLVLVDQTCACIPDRLGRRAYCTVLLSTDDPRDQENLLRPFLDATTECVLVADPERQIVLVHCQKDKDLDYYRSQFVGKSVDTVLSQQALSAFHRGVSSAEKRGPSVFIPQR